MIFLGVGGAFQRHILPFIHRIHIHNFKTLRAYLKAQFDNLTQKTRLLSFVLARMKVYGGAYQCHCVAILGKVACSLPQASVSFVH